MSVAVASPSRASSADEELQRSVSNLTLSSSSSSIAADGHRYNRNSTTLDTSAASSSSSSVTTHPPSSSALSKLSTGLSATPASSSSLPTSSSSPSTSSPSTSSPLYVPPPSAALPSSSPYFPNTLRAPPGQTLTIEGADNRRHTYNDQGLELGNDPLTGCYEEVEIEDMEWEAGEGGGGGRWTYPCPCGDRFVLTVDEVMDGECIARCPSCSLVIKVIYDPEDVFEQEGDSDDD